MGDRGRHSTAELTVIKDKTVSTVERPKPPGELTPEQAAEWRAIVNRLPADWFTRETHGLLTQYCRHLVATHRIAALIQTMESSDDKDVGKPVKLEDFDLKAYDRLLQMQEREGRAMSSLATRMRITQHSTYDATKKKPPVTKKPWQNDSG